MLFDACSPTPNLALVPAEIEAEQRTTRLYGIASFSFTHMINLSTTKSSSWHSCQTLSTTLETTFSSRVSPRHQDRSPGFSHVTAEPANHPVENWEERTNDDSRIRHPSSSSRLLCLASLSSSKAIVNDQAVNRSSQPPNIQPTNAPPPPERLIQ